MGASVFRGAGPFHKHSDLTPTQKGATIKEYRKEIELDLNQGYTFVELGLAPEMPAWHHLAQPSRWPFPSENAAFRFAEAHKVPGRDVAVLTRDGERFVL
ncbi:hypothetical protein SEA_HEXAMO_73 [Mycobacterium phage Hexamo]|nr:hypothetical protein SEA_HEXAMO_73 [Mycobacterium phage Hexamo]